MPTIQRLLKQTEGSLSGRLEDIKRLMTQLETGVEEHEELEADVQEEYESLETDIEEEHEVEL